MAKPVKTAATPKKRRRLFKQYAALPYIVRDGALLVMLVTSRETKRWVLPKGWPERKMKSHQVATQEAYEEAGLIGESALKPYAAFNYFKRLSETRQKRCHVEVFLFAVHRELSDWPEKRERKRRWMTPEQAARSVAEVGLRKLLRGLRLEAPGSSPSRG